MLEIVLAFLVLSILLALYICHLLVKADASNPANIYLAIASVLFAGWSMADIISFMTSSIPLALTRWIALHLLPLFILYFTMSYPQLRKTVSRPLGVILLAVPPLLLMGIDAVNMLRGRDKFFNIGPVTVHQVYSLIYIVAAAAVMLHSWTRMRNSITRAQMKFMVLGTGISLTATIFLVILPALILNTKPRGAWGILFLISAAAGLLRNQALDLRGVARDVLSALLLSFFLLVGFGLLENFSSVPAAYLFYWKALKLGFIVLLLLVSRDLLEITGKVISRVFPFLSPGKSSARALFILYRDGRLMGDVMEESFRSEFTDKDIFTSMLSAVESFMGDSPGQESRNSLRSLNYGKVRMIIEHGTESSMVLLYQGDEGRLRNKVARLLEEFESTHEKELASWSGDTAITREIAHRVKDVLDIVIGDSPVQEGK